MNQKEPNDQTSDVVVKCGLVHYPCGACGGYIALDGSCECSDNRRHPVAKTQSQWKTATVDIQFRCEECGDLLQQPEGRVFDVYCNGCGLNQRLPYVAVCV